MPHPLHQDFTHRHLGRQLVTPNSTQAVPLRKAVIADVEKQLTFSSDLDRKLLMKAFCKGLKVKSSAGQSISVVYTSTEFAHAVGDRPSCKKLNGDNAVFNELLNANGAFFIGPHGSVLLRDTKNSIPLLTETIMDHFSSAE